MAKGNFFFKYTGKLLKDPASANLKQFGLHLLSTLKCINSFRAFGTFHRLRDTADVSSGAASQALISVQIASLLNSKSFSSKNSLIMQLQGTSRGGHSGISPHIVISFFPELGSPDRDDLPLHPSAHSFIQQERWKSAQFQGTLMEGDG